MTITMYDFQMNVNMMSITFFEAFFMSSKQIFVRYGTALVPPDFVWNLGDFQLENDQYLILCFLTNEKSNPSRKDML